MIEIISAFAILYWVCLFLGWLGILRIVLFVGITVAFSTAPFLMIGLLLLGSIVCLVYVIKHPPAKKPPPVKKPRTPIYIKQTKEFNAYVTDTKACDDRVEVTIQLENLPFEIKEK